MSDAASRVYDLIVVGGGIHGVSLALEAARRGLRPLLLERGDFGGATSWNSLRIVHGGLRYLQKADLRRFRESVRERRWLLSCYPELVKPLACLMPLYGEGMRRPLVLRAALMLNDALSARRNDGVDAASRIPPGRLLSRQETLGLFPSARQEGLRGAAMWHDASMEDAPRLLMELLRWACGEGSVCLNYVEVSGLTVSDGRVTGVKAFDHVAGIEREFRATRVANCTGPWSDALARTVDPRGPQLFPPSGAFNLLLDREPIASAVVAVSPPATRSEHTSLESSNPTYFLRPWRGFMLVGTRHVPRDRVDATGPSTEELQAFLEDLNRGLPELRLEASDVVRVHMGFLPAKRATSTQLATRDVVHSHATTGGPEGLVSVAGVKYTTARSVARRTLRVLFGRRLRPATAACEGRPALAARISLHDYLTLERERPQEALEYVRRLQREEAAQCGEDIVLRRTDWAKVPKSDRSLIGRVARSLRIPERMAGRES